MGVPEKIPGDRERGPKAKRNDIICGVDAMTLRTFIRHQFTGFVFDAFTDPDNSTPKLTKEKARTFVACGLETAPRIGNSAPWLAISPGRKQRS